MIELHVEGEQLSTRKRTRRLENSTFRGADPIQLNACVGDNGSPQVIEYARGYTRAALLLLDAVIEDWEKTCSKHFHVDEFIYPICFNMRHAVELHLKEAATSLVALSEHRKKLAALNLKVTHDLFELWRFVKESAPLVDRRLPPLLAAMDEYIYDLAEVDATGQVFRYPYDTDSKKHLVEVSIISAVVLRERFGQLSDLLEELFRLSEELQREYRQGTFTKSLSRHDLSIIAERLPPRALWNDDDFQIVRTSIRREYALSGRECSEALDLIQRNSQFAAKIGIELPPNYLEEQDLFAFLDKWCEEHDLEKYKRWLDPSFHEKIEVRRWDPGLDQLSRGVLKAALEALERVLTVKKLSEIDALFYFADNARYCEEYVEMRDMYIMRYERNVNSFGDGILHMLEKTNGMNNIVRSLHALGLKSWVSKIADRYALGGHLQWIIH